MLNFSKAMATVIESTMSFKEPTATQARCRKTNEAMLILCRIDIAEAGKPYWKNTRQIPHFINQHDSYRPPRKCHVTQKSRNSSVSQKEKKHFDVKICLNISF